jgi:hypothetical protein
MIGKPYECTVKQLMYEEFNEQSGIKIATATEWSNGDGIDVNISRKHLPDIHLSLTVEDIELLERIFLDMGFS